MSYLTGNIKIIIFTLISIMFTTKTAQADVDLNPAIPNFGVSTANDMISKAKVNINNTPVGDYQGYKVTDSRDNTFYVDDIKNPKYAVILNQVEDNSLLGKKVKNKVDIDIGKICFTLTCN